MRFFVVFAVFALLISLSSVSRADIYVWQDAKTGLSLSFPDDWDIINNQQPDDVLTIMAPSGRGHSTCKVSAHEDRRFAIYPPRYADEIQKLHFSSDFWQSYLKSYLNADLVMVRNGAGLGRGYAGYAVARYDNAVPGPLMARKALMFASLYGNMVYVLECSAHKDAFADWKSMFVSIAGSVDFQKADHQFVTGNYRQFLNDDGLKYKGIEGKNYVVY